MPRPLHDPHDTIIRKVLLYPANGDEPHVTDMEISTAGGEFKHPYAFYTTGPDLRNTYGKYIYGIRTQVLEVNNQPEELKCNEGEYIFHFNIDICLPLNLSMARVVGINPKRPGTRPTWRGDVIFVKQEEWPGPLVRGGGAHMNYLDVDPSLRGVCDSFIRTLYQSDEWKNLLQSAKEHLKYMGPETGASNHTSIT
jgi:hypothetical protein